MTFDALLTTTMTVTRPGATADAVGGKGGAATTIATGVACRIRALSGRERATNGKDAPSSTHRVYYKPGPSVREGDTMAIGSSTYRVVFLNPQLQGAHHVQADVARYG